MKKYYTINSLDGEQILFDDLYLEIDAMWRGFVTIILLVADGREKCVEFAETVFLSETKLLL